MGRNFSGGNSSERSLIGGNFPGGDFRGGSFLDTVLNILLVRKMVKKLELYAYCFQK